MVSTVRTLLLSASIAAALISSCPAGQAMELTSPDFTNGATLALAQVNSRCGGGNRSPALAWSGAPSGTRSYALTLFDPDAGGGRGFWHWFVFDIPAGTSDLPEGAGAGNGLAQGAVEATNGFGEQGYGGACPPPGSGTHHYEFTLYALGAAKAPFGADASGTTLTAWLKSHALATATLTALYRR
jgi:Raf kinase inhibitor-like YbhB/YbcL family protein